MDDKVNEMPVIAIHLSEQDKTSLQKLADNNYLPLTTYCRIALLKLIRLNKPDGLQS